jgi:hypothetical protein
MTTGPIFDFSTSKFAVQQEPEQSGGVSAQETQEGGNEWEAELQLNLGDEDNNIINESQSTFHNY